MRVNGETRLFGLVGQAVGHSLSPAMHNAAFHYLGINAIYLGFSVDGDDLPSAVQGLCSLGTKGWNVTAPHKMACAHLADDLIGPAQVLRAVNTMLWDGCRLVGYNTDVSGLARAWQEHRVQAGQSLLLLGAGGAARAAVWAACSLGLKVTVACRSPAGNWLEAVRQHFRDCQLDCCPWDEREEFAAAAQLVVNATPLGEQTFWPLNPVLLGEDQLACDLAYGRSLTPWLRECKMRGCLSMDGREMLLYQGVDAFRLFMGREAPLSIMRQALYGGVARTCSDT